MHVLDELDQITRCIIHIYLSMHVINSAEWNVVGVCSYGVQTSIERQTLM